MAQPTFYRSVQLEDLSIFYREAGPKDATTLLLLHGLPSSSRTFEPLFARLSDCYQSDLFYDYRTNVDAYPKWQDWMRRNQPRLLVIWGKYDPSFDISEPEAYRRDVPKRRCISSMPVTSHWTRLRTRSRHWSEIFSAHLAEVAFERTTILLWASSWSTDIAGRSDRVRLRQQGTSVESASVAQGSEQCQGRHENQD
jgi:hypothetical protein